MNRYQAGGFSMLPPVVKNLLIINILMFLATFSFENGFGIDLNDKLGLHWPGSEKFEVYQVVTYMFMHGNFQHIFFNMFAVWMFGSAIENYWGAKRFLTYYVITGIGAAVFHYAILYFTEIQTFNVLIEQFLVNPSTDTLRMFIAEHQLQLSERIYPEMYSYFLESEKAIDAVYNGYGTTDDLITTTSFFAEYQSYYLSLPNVVGASGSLFGLLLAFGMLFPNQRIFLIFLPIPIKAKYFVIGYGLIELYSGLSNNPGDNVAHFAHLGGMIFGFFLIKLWQKRGDNNSFYQQY